MEAAGVRAWRAGHDAVGIGCRGRRPAGGWWRGSWRAKTGCEESEISGVSFDWIAVEIADLTIWSNGTAFNGRRGGEIEEIVSA
jgi:hypothetical protein